MVNHVRTLLYGLDGHGAPTAAGEEFTDPAFKAPKLPGYLAAVRAVLFGADPDRRMLAYRLRQYMAMLHATELEEFVLAYDPRVTYAPAAAALDLAGSVTATPVGHTSPLYLGGAPPAEAGSGRTTYSWTVTLTADPALAVTRTAPGPLAAATAFAFAAGLSPPVPLPGSPLTARAGADAAAGSSWVVTALVAPTADPGAVAASLAAVGDDTAVALFGAAPAEPYATWKALWYSNRPLPYRLGAALLAYAARADDARKGGG